MVAPGVGAVPRSPRARSAEELLSPAQPIFSVKRTRRIPVCGVRLKGAQA